MKQYEILLVLGIALAIVLSGCTVGPIEGCEKNADCDDENTATKNLCIRTTGKCSNAGITECINADGYCPEECSNENDSDCPVPDECTNNSGCEDNNPCTNNTCTGTPKTCQYIPITSCTNDDGCCQANCSYSNDNDCSNQECQSDSDCEDNDDSTEDSCVGIPKKCENKIKTCEKRAGDICGSAETCSVDYISSLDSTRCCPNTCTMEPVDLCADILCFDNEKCVAGVCVLKTCSELGGKICPTPETCNVSPSTSSDTTSCCTGECEISMLECGNDIDCFIAATETCSKASLTHEFTVNLFGFAQTSTTYYETIVAETGKCTLYHRLTAAQGYYDEDGVQTLLDQGKTQAEIDTLEQQMNDILQGMIGTPDAEETCKYEKSQLTYIIQELKQGNMSSIEWEDCELV